MLICSINFFLKLIGCNCLKKNDLFDLFCKAMCLSRSKMKAIFALFNDLHWAIYIR
jgi:hypothetical protein